MGAAGRGIYRATKHGILGLTKCAALEHAAGGIRINAVCPGVVETPMAIRMRETQPEAMASLIEQQPIRRLCRPEEVASVVLWLCSSGASYVIGHALVVDGGYTVS
jgi:NAD(P)-dependent dehydrogenase (short-subunit alcohol dehydrogenase family)